MTTADRRAALNRVAEVMAADRGRTIAVMAHETGKTVREGDSEVSEAIDFARWSAACTRTLDDLAARRRRTPTRSAWSSWPGRGTSRPRSRPTGSSPPWRPATPCCSSRRPRRWRAAPSSCATSTTAGVPDDVVQLVRCPDDDVGRHLVTHPGVDGVVLTGSYDTARLFLSWQPSLRLLAETSGKNALVISQTADVDLALRDLVRSAFGHAGQKCSAASLAIVEAPLYDDAGVPRPAGRRRAQPARRAGDRPGLDGRPGDRPAGGQAAPWADRARRGESWLVEPRPLDDAERLWTTRRAPRRAARILVPPDRVLRAGPRRDAGRRPGPRRRAAERRRRTD